MRTARLKLEVSYYWYDARGQRTHVLSPRGYSTYYRFDLLGRNTHREHALGGVAYMGYDAVGNQVLASDELGQSTYLTYDGLRRLTHSKDQAAGVTYMGYDNRSSLVLRVDANGRATYMGYDAAKRATRQSHKTPVGGETETSPSYYVYNQASELTIVDDRLASLGVSYFDYDRVGRVLKKATLAGFQYYEFDLSGTRSKLVDPSGETNYYVFDAVGRLTTEQLGAGRTAYFAYDRSGKLTSRMLPGNTVQGYWTYDSAGRLATLTNRNPDAGVLSSQVFTRDASGQITRFSREDGSTTYYDYDALDRLTLEKRLSNAGATVYGFQYSYDQASNRTVKGNTQTPLSSYFSYDTRNLLSKQYDLQTNTTTYFDYDAAQRMTAARLAGAQSSYFTHDQRDRVARVDFNGGVGDAQREFGYTGLSERVYMLDGESETYLSYDGRKLIREVGEHTRTYRHNMAGNCSLGELLETTDTKDLTYRLQPVTNQRGDVLRMVENLEGGTAVRNEDDAMGVVLGTGLVLNYLQRFRYGAPAGLIKLNMLSDSDIAYAMPGGKLWFPKWTRGTSGLWVRPEVEQPEPPAPSPEGSDPAARGAADSVEQGAFCDWCPPDEATYMHDYYKGNGRIEAASFPGFIFGNPLYTVQTMISYYPSDLISRCCEEIQFFQIWRVRHGGLRARDLFRNMVGKAFPHTPTIDDKEQLPKPGDQPPGEEAGPRTGAGLPFAPHITAFFQEDVRNLPDGPQPKPYYPTATNWLPGRTKAFMSDTPGPPHIATYLLYVDWWGMDFDTCAICVRGRPGTPQRLTGAALSCVRWGFWIERRHLWYSDRYLTTPYVAPPTWPKWLESEGPMPSTTRLHAPTGTPHAYAGKGMVVSREMGDMLRRKGFNDFIPGPI